MPILYFDTIERWDFLSPLDGKLKLVVASDIPFVTYENGLPCYEANMYTHNQLCNSRRPSSLKTYAKHIHHIINFCYKNKIMLTQITNDIFTLFVNFLQSERDKHGELVRSINTTVNIAYRCIDFLKFVQYYHDLNNFIGTGKENAIIVKERIIRKKIEGSNVIKEFPYITHTSIPSKDAIKRRMPISEDDALIIWGHICTQANRQKRYRDIALYQCLEQLGARITEITFITLDDINKALESGDNPLLKLTTLKRKDDEKQRYIPVTASLLNSIKIYINKTRKKVIKRTIGSNKDHGYLFVSLTTGRVIKSGTLTSYMNTWKKKLGIVGEVHPHLFRHAFITNKLREIILSHKDITSADKFREHLLNTERFKMQLKEWTGHTHLSSLDIYINLVLDDLNGYSEAYNAVQLKDSVTVVKQQIQHLKLQLNEKSITMTEGLQLVDDTLAAFEKDIDAFRCRKTKKFI
jgi:integrase